MKCLEKDRQRRYETANGLATDVARHLKTKPSWPAHRAISTDSRNWFGGTDSRLPLRVPWPRRSSSGWAFQRGPCCERRKPAEGRSLPRKKRPVRRGVPELQQRR